MELTADRTERIEGRGRRKKLFAVDYYDSFPKRKKKYGAKKAAINVLISPALLSEREQKAQRQVCPILLRQKSVKHTIQNGVTDRRRIDVFDFPESTVIESGEGN